MLIGRPVSVMFVVALFLFTHTRQASCQEISLRPPDPNDPLQRKGIIALLRAAQVVKIDTKTIRLGLMDQPNAAYAGNGQFLLGTPFLSYPQSALDAIMAHEMGHAVLRHVEKGQLLRSGILGGFGLLGALLSESDRQEGAATGQQFGAIVTHFVFPKFSQAEESQADAYAVKVLRAEGYKQPGNTMAGALDILRRQYGNSGGGFFDTHPATTERIRHLVGK
jgi:Zn-dependent protease with chaperone function